MRVVLFESIWSDELARMLDPALEFVEVDPKDRQQRDRALADADILVSARFTADMGGAAKKLRLIVCPAAGTESIDRSALGPGVRVVNGSGHEIAMAEYVVGSLVALRQQLLVGDRALRRGEWRFGFFGGHVMLEELHGSNLGLVGFGRIGSEVARRAVAFGMQCAALTLHPQAPREGTAALQFLGNLSEPPDVDKLVAWSDQLVLCCELSALTRGLMDARRFALMKATAVLVNVARGPIVVERDLYDALATKRIAGAALDVWFQYPGGAGERRLPSSLPFHELDNVIMTPHASGWTEPAKRRRLEAMAAAINGFARAEA